MAFQSSCCKQCRSWKQVATGCSWAGRQTFWWTETVLIMIACRRRKRDWCANTISSKKRKVRGRLVMTWECNASHVTNRYATKFTEQVSAASRRTKASIYALEGIDMAKTKKAVKPGAQATKAAAVKSTPNKKAAKVSSFLPAMLYCPTFKIGARSQTFCAWLV